MMECPVCYGILHSTQTPYTHTAAHQCESLTWFVGSVNISFKVRKTDHLILFICSLIHLFTQQLLVISSQATVFMIPLIIAKASQLICF